MNRFALLTVGLLLFGCSEPQSPASSATPTLATPASSVDSTSGSPAPPALEVDSKQAAELAGRVKNRVFPYEEQNKKENARVFLYLASTSSSEEVVLAALDGMTKTFSPGENPQKEKVDEAYRAVVLKLLDSSVPAILGGALEAAQLGLQGQTEMSPLSQKVLQIAQEHSEAAARLEALNALQRMKDFQQNEAIASAFLKAMQAPEPYLKSLSLFRIQFNNYNLARKPDFYSRAAELMKDPDAGVRGRALEVASVLVSPEEQASLGQQITAMLGDKSAYVRSVAADALGRLGYRPAIPKMVELLDDQASNTYDISYRRLNGSQGSEHHDGSAWSRVDDAMLWGLSQLTFSFGPQKFSYGKIDYKNVPGDIAREVKLCKSWYAKNRDALK